MKHRVFNLLGLIALVFCLMADAHASAIYVFTHSKTTIALPAIKLPNSIQVVKLGELKTLVNVLDLKLQGLNPMQARTLAKTWFQTNQVALHDAVKAEQLARQFDITQVPTIVFDEGAFKVLGQSDVGVAEAQYHQWLKNRRLKNLKNSTLQKEFKP